MASSSLPIAQPAPPSVTAVAIASLIVGAVGGYFLGAASSVGVFGGGGGGGNSSNSSNRRKRRTVVTEIDGTKGSATADDDDHDDSTTSGNSSSGDGGAEGQSPDMLSDWASASEELKMTLVVRTDLGMTKGKIAAQCSHGTLANYKTLQRAQPGVLSKWERRGQAKVALQVKSEDELDVLYASALSLGLCANVIHDAGRTQIASGSATVLAVGPGPKSVVDQCTGHLKLL